MLEFITNNSIWFIIGGVLIILVIIGYFADKKFMGTKQEKVEEVKEEIKEEKVEEKPKKKSKKEDISMDIPFVTEQDDITEKVEEPKQEENVEEDLNAPFGDVTSNLDEFASQEVTDTSSNLDEFASKPVENESSNLDEFASNEDLSVPFGDPVKEEQNVEETKEQKVEDTIVEEPITDLSEEDEEKNNDIWNF